MLNPKKFIVSHAPFWHDESKVSIRYYTILIATLPAALFGIYRFGMPALAVISLSISSAISWELLMNRLTKRSITITDGNAALIGMIFAMLLPATAPWWLVIVGTFLAIVVGKHIYGGIGANPFNPAAVAVAILMLAWKQRMDFDSALVNYVFDFPAFFPLAAVKAFGTEAVKDVAIIDLFLGRQTGGIGTICGVALLAGGIYLVFRGVIRWEIAFSFLIGVAVTAFLFNLADPAKYAPAGFHLLTGFSLLGAFFLAPDDATSPVNPAPMLLYGAAGGVITVLIRNIGAFSEGVVFAILVINLVQPLLDKIRPNALGKVE